MVSHGGHVKIPLIPQAMVREGRIAMQARLGHFINFAPSYRRMFTGAAAVALAFACALSLSGCHKGAQHQIVDPTENCTTCHGEKQTFDNTAHNDALQSNGTVHVKADATQLIVCKPVFTSSDGSAWTPIRDHVVAAPNGEADVTLPEGVWAICVDKGDSSTGKIVVVTADAAEGGEITL